MKFLKLSALFTAILALVIVTSCGDDTTDPPAPTAQELAIEALNSGGWSLTSSNVPDGIDLTGASATLTATGVTITGSDQISAIAYSVNDAGALTGATVTIKDNALEVDGPVTASVNSALTSVTVNFSLAEAGGRIGGVGAWSLVFSK